MPLALVKDKNVRFRLHIASSESFADDVADFGRVVPPRGAGRTSEHREDYCLRRFLVAQFIVGRLKLPLTVEARGSDTNHYPDFTITFDDGEVLGIEHTEAGTARWQQWLSEIGRSEQPAHLMPGDGYVGDEPERIVVRDVTDAIRRKTGKTRQGAYAATTQCDLLIYENSEGGIFVEPQEIAERLRAARRDGRLAIEPFTHVHLVIRDLVWLDLFGDRSSPVDVSGAYAEDWSGWLLAQSRLIRAGRITEVDAANLAEELEALARKERRALASQFRRLLLHLLKMRAQPERGGQSWLRSVISARRAIQDILEDSPSLESSVPAIFEAQYGKARRDAAKETRLDLDAFPAEAPFTIDEVLDEDFFPGTKQ